MQAGRPDYKTVVVGGGPAGTGLLFNAMKKGELEKFLDSGVAFIEKSGRFGSGSIGKYIINSDTTSNVFLECLAHDAEGLFNGSDVKEMARYISGKGTGPLPLSKACEYLGLLGNALLARLSEHGRSRVMLNSCVTHVQQLDHGNFVTSYVTGNDGPVKQITSTHVVLAGGGMQNKPKIESSLIAPSLSLDAYRAKIVHTDAFFTMEGFARTIERVQRSPVKKVVIIGSSHSAFSSAGLLLYRNDTVRFGRSDITVAYRGKLKLFYPDRKQALSEGYTEFDENDICPLTQKVYRLAGLRLDSAQLLKKIMGLHPEKENRVALLKICGEGSNRGELERKLDEAAVIIPAFGYEPAIPKLTDHEQMPMPLACRQGGPLVNRYCQVIDQRGEPVKNLYGIGLASGFVPWGPLGGEPGFKGQTNGLWLYQNGVGELIYDQVMRND